VAGSASQTKVANTSSAAHQPAGQRVQTVELTVEGDEPERVLPCTLRISRDGKSMVLDFHAEASSAPRIREQAQELGLYLNENRGDESKSRSPGGRPHPESFPVRQILKAQPIARVQDLPDGARLTLSPNHLARAERLQAEVLWHAGDLLPGLPLAGKTCPELPSR
jgi:hypothetical protein